MKYIYMIIVFCPDPYDTEIPCVCESEADAQEMVFSIEQEADYDEYLRCLEYDYTILPQDFPLKKPYPRTATYEAIKSF